MKTKENSNLRKNLAERVNEVRTYYLSGNTIEQTALEFGVSTSTITRFFIFLLILYYVFPFK